MAMPHHRVDAETSRPVTSLLELRSEKVILQQWDTSCGAAALATLLTYQHHYPVSERYIAEAMLNRGDPLKVKVRGGFSLLDMKRFVQTLGFIGDGYQGLNLAQLNELGPAIIPVDLGAYNHFVVFRGMGNGTVLLADPAFGNRAIDQAEFQHSWLGNIAFIVQGRGKSDNSLGLVRYDAFKVPTQAVRQAIR